jgi:broad specificity phosphatase PhoE
MATGAPTTFYLVRHAHADWEPDEMRPLSPRGEADALRVADTLAPYPISCIVSSPYRRAVQTLQPLADRRRLSIQLYPGLRERTLTVAALSQNAFERAVRATWDNPQFAHPGGESNAAAQQRAIAVVQELTERCGAEDIAVATHGNLMALILQHFAPTFDHVACAVDFAFWAALTMPDIYRLTLHGDGLATAARLWDP